MRKKILSKSVLAAGSLVLLLAGVYAFADWTPPVQAPPLCTSGSPGCDAPIHVGFVGQVKDGGLTVAANDAVVNGLRVLYGKVGIGTPIPAEKLDVVGNIAVSGQTVIDSSGSFLGEIEPRTSDPVAPPVGRIWLRTDL